MKYIFFLLAFCSLQRVDAQKIISLYSGAAPGSENWTWPEQQFTINGDRIILDVSKPAVVAYLPEKPNGTAMVIAPGGAFHALAFDLEGESVAKKLIKNGVTAFVLKYRVVHDDPSHPENNLMTVIAKGNFKKLDSINSVIVPLAMQDGLTAVKYVRQHAKEYGINPQKIGFMGFSAGATVALSVVYNASDESRPNFVAPIYAYAGPVIGNTVPAARTPIFIAVASDDDFGFAPDNVQLYLKWQSAKQPAELHVYEKGGHGFGTKTKGLPVDSWMDRFTDWLKMQGYVGK